MRLVRFGNYGAERPGVLDASGDRLDLSSHFPDWDSRFFADPHAQRRLASVLTGSGKLPRIDPEVRWGAPVARPGKIICIGLNYSDHAAETGAPIPAEPIVFLKAPNTVVGPYDDLQIPRHSVKTDWEVELGVVIGKTARYLETRESAAAHIAGYVLTHDVSEREFQIERGGQWTKGKSCDTFNPLGPFVATPDEVRDPQDLSMTLLVNGQLRQNGSTSTMIFDVLHLVMYLSNFMTLEPGDLISTGTPPGVGLGMKPPVYLKPGDVVELSIEGLGSQRQLCVSAR